MVRQGNLKIHTILFLFVVLFLSFGKPAYAEPTKTISNLIAELSRESVLRKTAHRILEDPRIHNLYRESTANCKSVRSRIFSNINEETLSMGVAFYVSHSEFFDKAESEYGIPREIILSIIRRETVFGSCMGDYNSLQVLTQIYTTTTKRESCVFSNYLA